MLLYACAGSPPDPPPAQVAGDSADSAAPVDTSPPPDTALAYTEWTHEEGGATDGVWTGGRLGTVYDELRTGRVACTVLGDWVDTGEPAPACPDCDWAFTLTVQDSLVDGRCDPLSHHGAHDGRWDGFDAAWAFTTHEEYAGYALPAALLTWYSDEWILFAYDGYFGPLTGDATAFVAEGLLNDYLVP